ncbi:hypothetical protein Tco_1296586 [Tanacetum coccineum]
MPVAPLVSRHSSTSSRDEYPRYGGSEAAVNPADQDSLNSAAGGNLLERMKSSDGNSSSSNIAKLTHAVNQQTSAVTTAMMAILKQFQATPPPASIKAVEEICVTCSGPHPYYQYLAADGDTFPEY